MPVTGLAWPTRRTVAFWPSVCLSPCFSCPGVSEPTPGQHPASSLGWAVPLSSAVESSPGRRPPSPSLRPFQGTSWLRAWSGEAPPTPSERQSCKKLGAFLPVLACLLGRVACLHWLPAYSQDLPFTSSVTLNKLLLVSEPQCLHL